jgi:hypothetical protein
MNGEFGDGLLGAVIVDQGFTSGGSGNQRGDGGLVERTRQPQAGFVEARDGIVGNERIGPSDQRQVVTQVGGGLGEVHRRQLVAPSDALVEGGEDAQTYLAGERGLTHQQQGERALPIHLSIYMDVSGPEIVYAE